MKLTLGLNVAALRTQRYLDLATQESGSAMQKLSSGLRINRAGDDAASLSIADSLKVQSNLATVAIRNVNDGLSLVGIGDSALGQLSSILQRMAELAEQAANGTYSVVQRSPIQREFEALGSEIERIAQNTKFNGVNLLTGSQRIVLQVGFDSVSTSRLEISGIQGRLSDIGLAQADDSALSYSVVGTNVEDSQIAARTALVAIMDAMQNVDSQRGMLGASESRLSTALDNLSSARVNFSDAETRIRSADIGLESAKLVSSQIRQQAATAILAQANLSQRRVLDLLSIN